jgi:hypothetical protein
MAKTVPLHGKKARGRVALVDDEDYEMVSQYRWRIDEREFDGRRPSGPYAITTARTSDGHRTLLSMHKLITGYAMTDHHDHDGLNNQRSNLRQATDSQNQANRRAHLSGASAYKGVFWCSRRRVWRASIKCHGKRKYLGTFRSEVNAAVTYDAAARMLFGEYAALNFPQVHVALPPVLHAEVQDMLQATAQRKPQTQGYAWMQSALRSRRRLEMSRESDTPAA